MSKSRGLVLRFLFAQLIVVALGLTVAAVVAAWAGPPLFHDHLEMAGVSSPSSELVHVEQAYQDANLISLTVASITALVSALIVSLILSRAIRRPLQHLTHAAAEVARGRWKTRVPVDGNGAELDELAVAFNTMAKRLDATERTRRRLLADLAHEMRTPVSVLAAYSEGLEDDVVRWDSSTSAVVTEQVTRLTRLVTDLDLVSRVEERQIMLEITPLSLADLVDRSVTAFRGSFLSKGVDLHLQDSTNRVTVLADHQRIAQVVDNLLSNALRHTAQGDKVSIEIHQTEQSSVSIDIVDNGDGMSPDQLENAFERFYRGDTARDRDHGGAGIGLTIARAFVEAHDGALTATSPGTNHGSRFTISLPLAGPGR